MKIYTKTGDKGETGLYGGKRVSKSSPRITAYGEVDELNALLGVAASMTSHEPIRKALIEIQATLFVVGAHLATPSGDPKVERMTAAHVESLERQIDAMGEALPELKSFILPGGSQTSSFLHLARTTCRRSERAVVHLSQLPTEKVDEWLMIYLNRLSDYLFVLARLANHLEQIPDVPWVPTR